jgi:hypothetical protein
MKINNSLPPISLTDLQQANASLGFDIPESYCSFLLESNGGQPDPNYFIKLNEKGEIIIDLSINVFWGINLSDTKLDLVAKQALLSDRIPNDLLPIGDDGIGNKICLGIKEYNKGKVYMWWHDDEADISESPSHENVSFVCDTFEQLLNGLREDNN